MKVVTYTDKSIVIYGDNTRKYKDDLKKMGGKFNGKLKAVEEFEGGCGWIFSKKNQDKIDEFLQKISTSNEYQTVSWNVIKPKLGMKVLIKGTNSKEYNIKNIEINEDIVDTVYIVDDEESNKLVIINGKWKIFGNSEDHEVNFI